MKIKLLPKFILSLGVIGVILTIAISLFSYRSSRSYLENLYAQRVMTNSNSIADMMSVSDVKKILAEGGDKTEEYSEMVTLFNKLKKDGDVTYLSLVVPDEDSVHFYIDALVEELGDDPANQIAYGSDILYTDAANPDDPADMEKYITIWNQYQQNKGVDHPLVTDNSYGYNYTGISVILDENGKALAEIQYILDMEEVRNYLNSFLINMFLISFCIIAVTMAAYIVFVRKTITRPISRLADFTQEITESGKFENQRITMKTGDEIEALSDSFNFMMEELENYIANLSKVTAEKERIGTELDIARNIQASMLPCIFPAFPDRKEFDIYATMTPAKEVGGDFYDFFMVDETHLAIVMADVSGKGVPAALFMVIGKTLIKDHTQYILDMEEVRNYLNSFLINMFLISFCIIAVTMAAYIVFVRKTITRPISRLADFTQEITESGKFENQRITMKTGDEIEALSDSFNFMMEELENYIANLSKVTAEKERIGTELDIARNIQASMLPCIFPAFPDRKEFDIYATMTPAKEVGGDFYDFFMVDETHLAIVMADVSGKGVPAALFMVIGKTLIKDHTTPGRDLGEVFSTVNNLLCEANSEGLFITAFEGVLDLVTGEFCFVNAGHEMPFICKAGASFEAYKIRPGFVLAGFEDMNYKAGSMTLDVGDLIFQYTDGVTEATNVENQLYGMERLEQVLNRVKDRTPSEILPEVKKDIDAFVGEAPQFDDITMLCVEYKAKMEKA